MYPAIIGAALLLATGALLLGDYHWNLFGAIPVRTLGKAAEKIGSIAVALGAAAFGVYILRLLLVRTTKNKNLLPPSLATMLPAGLKILRHWHPLIGSLAISLAALHGYVLLYAKATKLPAIYSGVPLICTALLLPATGWYLRAARNNLLVRKIHTYIAFAALALLLLHMALAD